MEGQRADIARADTERAAMSRLDKIKLDQVGAPGGCSPWGGLINETAKEETVSRAGRTRRPIYLPNNLPYHYLFLSC